jgi:hypothetical protein
MHAIVRLGFALMILGSSCAASAEPECGLGFAFGQRDADAPQGVTPVWSDASGSALLFGEKLHVNTDGTRRSYRVDDFWGKRTALNNVCNAMSDGCAGLTSPQLRERREITQRAAANGWPQGELRATKLSERIIAFHGGKPCTTSDGFLVSATSLRKRRIDDVCDPANYVDSLAVAAIVLPQKPRDGASQFEQRNARIGDLAVAIGEENSDPVLAVVGDHGPSNKLGEASLALNGRLLGKSAEPTNYTDAKTWVVGRAFVLIFPGSRDADAPFLTQDRIDSAAQRRFEAWGGIERLKACRTDYGMAR